MRFSIPLVDRDPRTCLYCPTRITGKALALDKTVCEDCERKEAEDKK